jgi:type III pantothenate kinase
MLIQNIEMVIALIDIGNTAIKVKLLQDQIFVSSFVLSSDKVSLRFFFEQHISQFIISSVVPELDALIQSFQRPNVHFLTYQDMDGLSIQVHPPDSVGVDRLVNAMAVQDVIKHSDVLIIDIGTAVTFCSVTLSEQNSQSCVVYKGGAILPGFHLIQQALFTGTSKLPLVSFPQDAPPLIGDSTEGAMESGLFHGAIHMINGMTTRIVSECVGMHVVLTGGVPGALLQHLTYDTFSPDLQFIGLRRLANTLNATSLNVTS